MQQSLKSLLLSRQWEAFIVVLIVVNAIILGLMTSTKVTAAVGPLLLFADRAILAIFVIEIALRIFAFRLSFFKDPWSLFDFFVVAIALMPATEGFSVLRALRILRVMRLISVVPTLRRVVGGLIAALPGMASIILLMVIIFYVFSVMATSLYGATFPDWFGSIGTSAYTLFQIMTLESWSMGIVRPVMEAHPYAWVFFVPFIMVTAFAVLTLFIGIIVSGMQQDVEEEAAASRTALMEEQVHVGEEVRALREEVRTLTAAIERLSRTGGAPR